MNPAQSAYLHPDDVPVLAAIAAIFLGSQAHGMACNEQASAATLSLKEQGARLAQAVQIFNVQAHPAGPAAA